MSTEPIDSAQLQLDVAIQIAANADSSPADLSLIVNKSVEVNRLLAAHPKATTAILSEVIKYRTTDRGEEFSHYDEQTLRIAVRHPNILVDDALRLGRTFPDDLFMNPSIDLIVDENPRLLSEDNYLDDNYSMLQAGGCPTRVLERIAVEGTRAEQAAVARNPRLP